MRREAWWGVFVGLMIIAPLLVPIWLRAFKRDDYGERWGRYEYHITRSGIVVHEGNSFRKENPDVLDTVASRILVEFLFLDRVETDFTVYKCVVFLAGYGVGEAWGR